MVRIAGKAFFLVLLTLWAAAVHAVDPPAAEEAEGALEVAVSGGLISLRAESVSLGRVLDELGSRTGAEFTVRTSAVPADMVSLSLRGLPFSEAVAVLLKNYSYIIEEGERPSVIVLASLGTPREAEAPRKAAAAAPREYAMSPAEKPSAGAVVVVALAEERPHDLEECQPLGLRGGVSEEVLQDAKVRRAQKALGMERCAHLWGAAIQELRGVQDPRVAAIFEGLARNDSTGKVGTQAVEALWHYAADSQFTNVQAVEALRGLAGSEIPGVNVKAREALRDYERYMSRVTP